MLKNTEAFNQKNSSVSKLEGWISLTPNWILSGLEHAPASHQGKKTVHLKMPLDGMPTIAP